MVLCNKNLVIQRYHRHKGWCIGLWLYRDPLQIGSTLFSLAMAVSQPLISTSNKGRSELISISLDTHDEQEQFFEDAQKLTADIIKPNASYGPVAALLNIHAVFVPSNEVSYQ
jgi:hypothetical protein